jgi:hypothetical protein
MRVKSQNKISGSTTQVGDCYIWAEIQYLDSTTDYREFLPNNLPRASPGDEFVLLDDIPHRRVILAWFLACAFFACVCLSAAGLFGLWI